MYFEIRRKMWNWWWAAWSGFCQRSCMAMLKIIKLLKLDIFHWTSRISGVLFVWWGNYTSRESKMWKSLAQISQDVLCNYQLEKAIVHQGSLHLFWPSPWAGLAELPTRICVSTHGVRLSWLHGHYADSIFVSTIHTNPVNPGKFSQFAWLTGLIDVHCRSGEVSTAQTLSVVSMNLRKLWLRTWLGYAFLFMLSLPARKYSPVFWPKQLGSWTIVKQWDKRFANSFFTICYYSLHSILLLFLSIVF